MTWWNQLPFKISPYIVEFNGFGIRYYSVMYVIAFLIFYILINYRLKNESFTIKSNFLDDFIMWAAIGVLLGGRLGYTLFYDFEYYFSHPLQIFLPFNFTNGFEFTGISGMSYHGGLIGVIFASYLYCRKNQINLWDFSDLITPAVPLGYTFGRLGNFFNGELYGRETTLPWGMYFPYDSTHLLRHPSQLYEAFSEGIILFLFLWIIRQKKQVRHNMFSLYLIGYGSIRFFIEFVRQPDEHLNTIFYIFSMGQILCFIMIICGSLLFLINGRKSPSQAD